MQGLRGDNPGSKRSHTLEQTPWKSKVNLTPAIVQAILSQQFPSLKVTSVERLNEGRDPGTASKPACVGWHIGKHEIRIPCFLRGKHSPYQAVSTQPLAGAPLARGVLLRFFRQLPSMDKISRPGWPRAKSQFQQRRARKQPTWTTSGGNCPLPDEASGWALGSARSAAPIY